MYNTRIREQKGALRMDRFGFIHEELDIKILILFVLRRLPGVVDKSVLGDLCRSCDDGFDYFEYSDCLADLIDNGLIDETDEGYSITEKGARNVDIVETDIPYSVRSRAEKNLRPERDRLRREAMIRTTHENRKDGCFVTLAMSDGEGDVINMCLLCGSEEQAKTMERNFRKKAEAYYQQFIELLSKQ